MCHSFFNMAGRMLSVEEFNAAYLQMRVDHLYLEEVDVELISRGVVIPPEADKAGSQRRRRLRGLLSDEMEQTGAIIALSFKGDVQEEIAMCRGKFESMEEDLRYKCPNKEVYRSRLLHVGYRLQLLGKYVMGEQFSGLEKILQKVITLYSHHFGDNSIPPGPTNQEVERKDGGGSSDDNSDPKPTPGKNYGNPSDRAVGEELLDVLLEIRAEVRGVKDRMAKYETHFNARVSSLQQSVEFLSHKMTAITVIAADLKNTNHEVKNLRETVSGLQQFINRNVPKIVCPDPPLEMGASGEDDNLEPEDLPKVHQSDIKRDSSKSFDLPVYHSQNFFKQSPVPNYTHQHGSAGSVEHTAYYRRPQRVADWKISKYAGNDEGTGLNEFFLRNLF